MPLLTTWDHIKVFINTTVERADLDFKERLPNPDAFEMAKDIAALANGLGGSILIGAKTTGKFLCTDLPGIPLKDAIALADQFERAAGSRCRPRAVLDCAVIRLPTDPNSAVLSVNVAAAAAAPIGVDLRDKGDDNSWKFPLRTTSQTVWLSPDQFGAFEQMTARRSGALLASIPSGEREQITLQQDRALNPKFAEVDGGYSNYLGDLFGTLVDVDYRHNVAYFSLGTKIGDGKHDFRVPLDWVVTAWRDTQSNRWMVVVDCVYSREDDAASWTIGRVGD